MTREEQTKKQEQDKAYVEALLEGTEPAPNSLVGYLVEELKSNSAELRAVLQTMKKAEAAVAQSRERAVELRGIGQKYYQDILAKRETTSPEEQRIVAF